MMKKLIYTCTLFSCLLFLMGCADDFLSGLYKGDGVQLTISLNVPGESSAATRAIRTRTGGTNQYDDHLDDQTTYQRYIADGDLYILVFENTGTTTEEWTLLAVPTITNISGENGDETREITALMSRVSGEKTLLVDVVANLAENGVTLNGSSTIDFNTMIGQTRETIYSTIGSFAYPTNSETNPYGVWSLETTDATSGTTTHRYLPMWGQSSTATTGGRMTYEVTSNTTELEVHCGLYRSVAKMGLLVDSECTTFQPTELYVYYINNEGTFVSLPIESGDAANWSPSINTQYTLPAVPTSSSNNQRAIEYPLVYKFSALNAGGSYLNNIYVTEADNKNNSTNPVCLVVGGYYTGGSYNGEGLVDGTSETDKYTLNYYRIDLESLTTDAESGTQTTGAFDIIRNHSYLFNIKNANNPGTSDPDPRSAAAGLEVEVLDYVDVPMYGINSQYTLTVNKSLFSFEGATTSVGELIISTDGTEWELVTDWNNMQGFPQSKEDPDQTGYGTTANELPDWAHLTDLAEGAHTNVNDTVIIEVDANVNNELLKNGSFWVRAGNIIKRIDLVQDYVETANSYLITAAGTYDAKVDIRGNGNTTAWTDTQGSETEEIDFSLTDSIPGPVYLAIIWETADSLVTIPKDQTLSESGCLSYTVNNVSLTSFGDWTGNALDPGNGGNALVGVFNANDSLIWSFHVWVCGDYADGVKTETWQTGSDGTAYYSFMDRNLGAYSNLPGSKSFGLLYQWGRKDPFIGAWREAGTDGTYARDFRQVRKQYTRHYRQKNDRIYVWSNYDDTNVTEATDIEYTIANPTTILNEGLLNTDHEQGTTQTQAQGLWGTANYAADVSETGNKTMYDPCPAGYRVPSLNALTIYDGYNNLWNSGTHSSLSCRFVPVPADDDFRTGNGHGADFVSGAPFYGFWLDYANGYGFNKNVQVTTETQGGTTVTTYTLPSGAYKVHYYSNVDGVIPDTCGWIGSYSSTNPGKPDGVTWIPMAGIYNGTMESFGRAGLTDQTPVTGTEPFLPASSLEVTSVLWANSPTQNNSNYPGGLLIHGTEGAYAPHQGGSTGSSYWYAAGTVADDGSAVTHSTLDTEGKGYWTTDTSGNGATAAGWWTGTVDYHKSSMDWGISEGKWNGADDITSYDSWDDEDGFSESGRHFHSYMESNASVYANPSYAASVRCIRDKDAIVHLDDKLYYQDENGDWVEATGNSVTLYLYDYESSSGGQTTKDAIKIAISYVEEWEVTYPGAKWISISPTSGSTTVASGSSEAIEITYTDNEQYAPSVNDTAIITITTARGTTFTITVVYVGGTRGESN